tara:strand:- start:456 stop:668 length:213 start_codon:yes stop_codon:yes gene_type:complete
MNIIKFKGKETIFLNGIEYKGYKIGDLPPSFGFKEKYLGQDEEGNDQYKYGKSHWFKYKGLTFIEKPPQW